MVDDLLGNWNGDIHYPFTGVNVMDYLRFTTDGTLLFTYNDKDYTITSLEDWHAAVADIKANPDYTPTSFMCSSSIDFPEEYTDNEDLLAICDAVRNGT